MNTALFVAGCAATLNLGTAFLQLMFSRAPGWRVTRVYAAIAATAAAYSVSTAVFCIEGLPDEVYLLAGRIVYLVAVLHCVAWLAYAFGGPEASLRIAPRSVQALAAVATVAALFFAATDLHQQPVILTVSVTAIDVTYHFPVTTLAGSVYVLGIPSLLALVFVQLARRSLRGERGHSWQLAGFAVFFLSAINDALLANGLMATPSLADLAIVCVVAPTSASVVARVIADARRLRDLSSQLATMVEKRTAERDRAESALLEAGRLAALGQLAAGVGHEINNPLAYVQVAIDEIDTYLARVEAPGAVREALASAQDGTARIQEVAERLRRHGQRPDAYATVQLDDVARAALKVAGPHLERVSRVRQTLGKVPSVRGDEPRLVQAVVNLLVNAAEAVAQAGGGEIEVGTGLQPSGRVELTVADTGPGVSAATLARLCEPYFTTRAARGGLGLGLFVSRTVVDAHAGTLTFESRPGNGMRVTLALPAAAA